MKSLIVLLALLTLTGCGGRMCHPYKGAAEFEQDKYMCTKGMGGNADAQMFNILNSNQCMQQRFGWRGCK